MNRKQKILLNGLIYENPLFVLMLGVCPALSVTQKANTALAMGLATLAVLLFSNIAVSCLKRIIPDIVRIPCYMAIIICFVTLAEYIFKAYFPALYEDLGVYLPLICVNCLILGRAEGFARKNTVENSAIDGLAMGLGYTFALLLVGMLRELLATGCIFGASITANLIEPMRIFDLAPGAFFVLAIIAAAVNKLSKGRPRRKANPCEACPNQSICEANKGGRK